MVFRVDDGPHLLNLVTDRLEGRAAIHHTIQDTPQRPHVTLVADLKENRQNKSRLNYYVTRWKTRIFP